MKFMKAENDHARRLFTLKTCTYDIPFIDSCETLL